MAKETINRRVILGLLGGLIGAASLPAQSSTPKIYVTASKDFYTVHGLTKEMIQALGLSHPNWNTLTLHVPRRWNLYGEDHEI